MARHAGPVKIQHPAHFLREGDKELRIYEKRSASKVPTQKPVTGPKRKRKRKSTQASPPKHRGKRKRKRSDKGRLLHNKAFNVLKMSG